MMAAYRLALLCLCALSPAWAHAVQDCEVNGENVNPNNGSETAQSEKRGFSSFGQGIETLWVSICVNLRNLRITKISPQITQIYAD
jgi:hypothetical protein